MSQTSPRYPSPLVVFGVLGTIILGLIWLVHKHTVAILQPRGTIARQEFHLLIFAFSLSLIVIIPIFSLTFYIAWKYRAGNTKARYEPDWDHNSWIETAWWLIPGLLITILSVVTWRSSHQLDPSRPLVSNKPPLTIEVVALDWKWLFLYPDQHIATVNYFRFPAGIPLNFEITADAPMNSFWIPQLGGQIYAMSGMSTQLHLMADQPGTYRGQSANISGRGFAGMVFSAESVNTADFTAWVSRMQQAPSQLAYDSYSQLAQPSVDNPKASYSLIDPNLYVEIVGKYGHNHTVEGS